MSSNDTKEQKEKLVLGYWKIRGLAQPIRNILEYTKTPYEDKCYTTSEEWSSDKYKLGLLFPNLPYLFDGDLKFTESNAILHYIGKKNNLYGSDDRETAIMNMILGHLYDWRTSVIGTAYNANFATIKDNYLSTTFANYAKEFDSCLAGKKWCLNDKLSIVDFVLYEVCDAGRAMGAELPSNIAAFITQFEGLSAIAEYFKSDRYKKRPFFSSGAAI